MKIEALIESLLYQYDCVIIPGFGGFVVNPKEAEIHGGSNQFYPPSREITFNQNLVRNDGLLCDAIAATENSSYDSAVKKIDDFVKDYLNNLSDGGEVEIGGVGVFRSDTSGILQFEPNRETNFLKPSFGLSSFRSPAIKRDSTEKSIEKKLIKALPKEVAKGTTSTTKKVVGIIRYWPAAAVFVLLAMVGIVYMQTDVFDDLSVNYSRLNPFEYAAESVYAPRLNDGNAKELPLGKDEIDLWLESIPEEPVRAENDVRKSKVVKRYHIIGGCFEFKANANKMMRRLTKRGFDPQLVGKNRRGLQRVAFGSYETRKEAREALKYVKDTQMSTAWLFVSKN